MSDVKFFIHVLCLLLIQLAILDNLQLHSYIYINIYILSIFIIPYRWKKVSILIFGFLLGLCVDIANHTMGIHAASTTLIAYIRPRLLLLTSNREQIDDTQGKQEISGFAWFFKYVLISTTIFNVALILLEAYTFSNFLITFLRIMCSTLISAFFMLLYYFTALKKRKDTGGGKSYRLGT